MSEQQQSRRIRVAKIIADADAGYVGAVGSEAHVVFVNKIGSAIFDEMRSILGDAPGAAPVDINLMQQLLGAYDRFEHHYNGITHSGTQAIKSMMIIFKTIFMSALIEAQNATN